MKFTIEDKSFSNLAEAAKYRKEENLKSNILLNNCTITRSSAKKYGSENPWVVSYNSDICNFICYVKTPWIYGGNFNTKKFINFNRKLGKDIVLVDSSFLICKMFYGASDICLYNTTNFIKKLRCRYNHSKLFFVFDTENKDLKFRKNIYPEYKNNRPSRPKEYFEKEKIIKNILDELYISRIESNIYEADDLIATICNNSPSINKIIIGKDKDLYSLVNDETKIIFNDIIIDEEFIIKKFGVKPDKISDYLALVGDSSDNIPGIKGIGPKKALKIINNKDLDLLENFVLFKKLTKLVNNIEIPNIFFKGNDFGVDKEKYYLIKEIIKKYE